MSTWQRGVYRRRYPDERLHRPLRRRWFPSAAPAGGIVSLQLAVAGVGTLSPTLSEQVALRLSVAGTSSVSPTLTENTVSLKTAIAGLGTLAANLTEQVALKTGIIGLGVLAAALRETVALKLGMAGQGSVSPNLTIEGGAPSGETSTRDHQIHLTSR